MSTRLTKRNDLTSKLHSYHRQKIPWKLTTHLTSDVFIILKYGFNNSILSPGPFWKQNKPTTPHPLPNLFRVLLRLTQSWRTMLVQLSSIFSSSNPPPTTATNYEMRIEVYDVAQSLWEFENHLIANHWTKEPNYIFLHRIFAAESAK